MTCLNCNLPSESFAAGCGETLRAALAWLVDQGDRTLFQRQLFSEPQFHTTHLLSTTVHSQLSKQLFSPISIERAKHIKQLTHHPNLCIMLHDSSALRHPDVLALSATLLIQVARLWQVACRSLSSCCPWHTHNQCSAPCRQRVAQIQVGGDMHKDTDQL